MSRHVVYLVTHARFKAANSWLNDHPEITGKTQHNGHPLFDTILAWTKTGHDSDVLTARLFYTTNPLDVFEIAVNRQWPQTLERVLELMEGPISSDYLVEALRRYPESKKIIDLLASRTLPTASLLFSMAHQYKVIRRVLLHMPGAVKTYGLAVAEYCLRRGYDSVACRLITAFNIVCTINTLILAVNYVKFYKDNTIRTVVQHMDVTSCSKNGSTLVERIIRHNQRTHVAVRLLVEAGASCNPSGIGKPLNMNEEHVPAFYLVARSKPLTRYEYEQLENRTRWSPDLSLYLLCKAFHGDTIDQYMHEFSKKTYWERDRPVSRLTSVFFATYGTDFAVPCVRRLVSIFGPPSQSDVDECLFLGANAHFHFNDPRTPFFDRYATFVHHAKFPWWTRQSHYAQSEALQDRVMIVLCVARRLLVLPQEMWLHILGFFRSERDSLQPL